MGDEEKITRHYQWSVAAEHGLSKVLDGYAEFYKKQVNSGVAHLYKIGSDSWMILRPEFDEYKNEKTLVGCCYQGKDYKKYMRMVIDQAKEQGFDKIRVHSSRPGIGRWLVNCFKYSIDETIYSLKVK